MIPSTADLVERLKLKHLWAVKDSETGTIYGEAAETIWALDSCAESWMRQHAESDADLKDTLKAVLYFFGPSGASKVTQSVIEARSVRNEEAWSTAGGMGRSGHLHAARLSTHAE